MAPQREAMEFGAPVMGAKPAGLAAAICPRQLAPDAVCVVERGGEVGAHILSGAVIETRASGELNCCRTDASAAPRCTSGPPTAVSLSPTTTRAIQPPTPPRMHNRGDHIVPSRDVCHRLGSRAEALPEADVR